MYNLRWGRGTFPFAGASRDASMFSLWERQKQFGVQEDTFDICINDRQCARSESKIGKLVNTTYIPPKYGWCYEGIFRYLKMDYSKSRSWIPTSIIQRQNTCITSSVDLRISLTTMIFFFRLSFNLYLYLFTSTSNAHEGTTSHGTRINHEGGGEESPIGLSFFDS